MKEPSGPRRWFRLPASPSTLRHDVDHEIGFHIDERVRELIEEGMTADDARAQATVEFGDVDAARTELQSIGRRRVRRERFGNWWNDFNRDLRFAVRSARRSPMFSLLAILMLGVGIGANAAIFATAKPLLFDPLPYAEQDRLVRVYARSDGSDRWNLTAGMLDELVRAHRGFKATSAFTAETREIVVDSDGQASIGRALWIQPGFFDTLGVRPALGRGFRADDVPANADEPASHVVLSAPAWKRHAGGAADAVGRQIVVNGLPRTVIGVLPQGFIGPVGDADFYFPLDIAPALADPVRIRRQHWLGLVARLAPGNSTASANDEVAAISARLAAGNPDDFSSIRAHAVSLRTAMAGDASGPIVVLFASALLLLMIA